jgi:hypothetical protein
LFFEIDQVGKVAEEHQLNLTRIREAANIALTFENNLNLNLYISQTVGPEHDYRSISVATYVLGSPPDDKLTITKGPSNIHVESMLGNDSTKYRFNFTQGSWVDNKIPTQVTCGLLNLIKDRSSAGYDLQTVVIKLGFNDKDGYYFPVNLSHLD